MRRLSLWRPACCSPPCSIRGKHYTLFITQTTGTSPAPVCLCCCCCACCTRCTQLARACRGQPTHAVDNHGAKRGKRDVRCALHPFCTGASLTARRSQRNDRVTRMFPLWPTGLTTRSSQFARPAATRPRSRPIAIPQTPQVTPFGFIVCIGSCLLRPFSFLLLCGGRLCRLGKPGRHMLPQLTPADALHDARVPERNLAVGTCLCVCVCVFFLT